MANQIEAINRYCPRLKLGKTVKLKELAEYLGGRTGLNKGEIQLVLSELSSAVQFFNKRGEGVKLEGLGIYTPKIDLKGKFSVDHRLDTEIAGALNDEGAYTGEIINKENIGKSAEDLVSLWNKDNPNKIISK
jgi:hypothetical protein